MRAVNKQARAVLEQLVAELDEHGSDGHVKIDTTDGAFMAVHVSRKLTLSCGTIYSVAHYYEQNGDLMSDPRMEFLRSGAGDFYPIYFEQHGGPPIAQESVVFGQESGLTVPTGIRERQQLDHALFASAWMQNIRQQQRRFFEPAKQAAS